MDISTENKYAIIANINGDKTLRNGAKVWILYCNGDAERPYVYGINQGGRRIKKYSPYKRMYNFRVSWVPLFLRKEFFKPFICSEKKLLEGLAKRMNVVNDQRKK